MNSLYKDIVRTIRRDRKRLLALMIITALGVMMMCGLKAACDDLRSSADRFFDRQRLHDIAIQSTLGLKEDDIESLLALDAIEAAEGTYREEVSVAFGDSRQTVAVSTFRPDGIDCPYVQAGTLPAAAHEIAVNATFLRDSGLKLGDHVKLIEKLDEEDAITIDTSDLEEEKKTPNFVVTDYVITASVTDIRNITNPDGTTSFRSTNDDKYVMFVLPEAVDSDVYTSVNLIVQGAAGLNTYSEEYKNLILSAMDQIETVVKANREKARYEAVYQEAEGKINDAKDTMNDAFAEADEKFADARTELDDGWQELADGEQELADGEQELADGEKKLNKEEKKADDEIASAKKKLANSRSKLTAGEKELKAAKKKLDASNEELQANEQQLKAAKQEIQSGYSRIESSYDQINSRKAQLESEYAQLTGEDPESEAARTQIRTALSELSAARAQLDGEKAALDSAMAEITANESALEAGKAEIEAGYAEIRKQEETLASAKKKLAAGEAELKAKEADARKELKKARRELEDGRKELEDGRKELEDGRKELTDGEAEYSDNMAEYREKKKDALDKIAEAEDKLADIPRAVWYVQDRTDLSAYANTVSDTDCIEAIGTVFPFMFLIIAVLISLTTITRMVEEDRGLIGTYQAMGFTDREIRRKYMTYSAVACVLGGILGNIGGFLVLPKILFIIFDTMYIVPDYVLVYSALFGVGGIILFAGCIVAASFISCENTLREMPASLMRPKPPRSGSRILLERIPSIWNGLSFLNKVTARNLFRYKKRFLMTVFGIAGCTGLLICGFSVKDTVCDLMPKQYEHIVGYDLMVVNGGGDDNDSMQEALAAYPVERQIALEISSVKIIGPEGSSVSAQMYIANDTAALADFIAMEDLEGKRVTPEDGFVYVTTNASRVVNFDAGDAVSIQDAKLNRADATVKTILQNYLGNSVFLTRTTYEELFEAYEENAALVCLKEGADEKAIREELDRQEYIASATSTRKLKETFSQAFRLMNLVVYIVIVLAAGLAFVVLFTLSNTNISERERELATIKVLGFFDPEVHRYVNKETLILTAIGIVCGLPLGTAFSYGLMLVLKLPAVEFDVSIHDTSYAISAALAFLFALAVDRITDRTLNRIDPVEALKSVE